MAADSADFAEALGRAGLGARERAIEESPFSSPAAESIEPPGRERICLLLRDPRNKRQVFSDCPGRGCSGADSEGDDPTLDIDHEKYHQIAPTHRASTTLRIASLRRHSGRVIAAASGTSGGGFSSALRSGAASASAYVSPATFASGGGAVTRLTTMRATVQITNRITAKWRKFTFAYAKSHPLNEPFTSSAMRRAVPSTNPSSSAVIAPAAFALRQNTPSRNMAAMGGEMYACTLCRY